MKTRKEISRIAITVVILLLTACAINTSIDPAPPAHPAGELIFYNWADYMPQSILEDFHQEFGITVHYATFDSQEEAIRKIETGFRFDVAVIEGDPVLDLVRAGWLAEMNFQTIDNFKNISANFRELSFDPGNRYSVPFNWGMLGLLVRPQSAPIPIRHWSDLWNPALKGLVGIRAQPKELIAIALKSLSYSINSEDPLEHAAALQRLVELKSNARFLETSTAEAVSNYIEHGLVAMTGWPADAIIAQSYDASIEYVLPEEGAMLWIENLVISANSPNQHQAMLFINYLLRPEVAAAFANETYYATTNEAAWPLLNSEILQNPASFPSKEDLGRAEWWLPLSPAGKQLWEQTWQQFLETP